MRLLAEWHYCYKTSQIARFCKYKSTMKTNFKNIVKYIQSPHFSTCQIESTVLASCDMKAKSLDSSIQKFSIDSSARDYFFANLAYFATYEKYYHGFPTGFGKIFSAHCYIDLILRLDHPDGLKMIWTIETFSWAQLLENNHWSVNFFLGNSVDLFLCQFQISSGIRQNRNLYWVADIVDNQ